MSNALADWRYALARSDLQTRFQLALAVSFMLHLLIIVGVTMRPPDRNLANKALPQLEVVLVNSRSATVPHKPDALAQASTRTADWIDRTSFQVEKVKTLEVRTPDGGGYRIERAADNADWKLEGLRPGEKVDTGRANAASYSLSLLELADVASKDAANTGLDKPTLINATTLAGRSYSIKVGRLEGENYYVSFQASGQEEKPREKLLSQHVLLIPKAKLEDTLKKRDELVEKKDTQK